MKRLSKEQILLLHSQLIQQTGGSDGVRDYALLESAIGGTISIFWWRRVISNDTG